MGQDMFKVIVSKLGLKEELGMLATEWSLILVNLLFFDFNWHRNDTVFYAWRNHQEEVVFVAGNRTESQRIKSKWKKKSEKYF